MNDSDLRGPSSLATDVQVLHHERLKHKNPMIGYLNINSLRNKLKDLKVILKYLSLDYFILNETKLDESFPNAQFTFNGYEIRARRDRNFISFHFINFTISNKYNANVFVLTN